MSPNSKPKDGAGQPAVSRARLLIGQPVHHKKFDYRGVVVDIDPVFQQSDDWYEAMARSRPPKNRPWYHVLVHGAQHMTYVAERHLEPDLTGKPIEHPLLGRFFSGFSDGLYRLHKPAN